MKRHALGIMQGRLSPPLNGRIQGFPFFSWKEEFDRARQCGLELIEWIFEYKDWQTNPLLAEAEEIRRLEKQTGVGVVSICADYFMEQSFLDCPEDVLAQRVALLQTLIEACARLDIRFLTLPFVDQSAIKNKDDSRRVVAALAQCTPVAEDRGVALVLETSLSPQDFHDLLTRIGHANVQVNYDIGNSASLGYDPVEELDAYGDRIATVHVKDRIKGGGTVPLGEGDAQFGVFFAKLAECGYDGPFIIQGARAGNETQVAKRYARFVRELLAEHFGSGAARE